VTAPGAREVAKGERERVTVRKRKKERDGERDRGFTLRKPFFFFWLVSCHKEGAGGE